MSDKKIKKIELLAPAGTLGAYEIAVQAGADAVYIGAPALNARVLAKAFTWPEIAAMIDYGHQHGVKTYIAMNSLLKEGEIRLALETMARLSTLKSDALIVQDLGIYQLAAKYFPELRLHASTLMLAHNSLAVNKFADMGFSRVVLARELTLQEIGIIKKNTLVELEVFVHGALCFSYSGLCLFSSYQGGKSGLRGACVQPCRRFYRWQEGGGRNQKGKSGAGGYLFSMNDLCAISLLPDLKKAGVTSFKIEGRLKNPQYVGNVVKAYRGVLDAENGADYELAQKQATELLGQSMGRKTTIGYLRSPQPPNIITPIHSGNIGSFLGKISGIDKNGMAQVTLKEAVQTGDRLRLHQEKSGERLAFTLKKLFLKEKPVREAAAGKRVNLEITAGMVRSGDSLYKVDTRESRALAGKLKGVDPGPFRKKAADFDRGRIEKAIKEIGVKGPGGPGRVRAGAGGRNKKIPALWLKIDNLQMLSQRLPFKPDRVLIGLDKKILEQFLRMRTKIKPFMKTIAWALPPVILEGDIRFYEETIEKLVNDGFRDWQIGHISQIILFAGRKVRLVGDYTLNILNSQAASVIRENGVGFTQLAIESDRENIGLCLGNLGKNISAGLTVYGAPPLFTTRLQAEHFHYNQKFISPKGEKFMLRQVQGMTLAVPDEPFSLLPMLPEIFALGIRYAVIDISSGGFKKEDLPDIARQLAGKHTRKPAGSFNYRGGLQ